MSSEKPRLLDLFCGAGGAAAGYAAAGFEVIGVDIAPQPRYPFEFVQADAIAFLLAHGAEFDARHASPPCPRYSAITPNREDHPDLVGPTREALQTIGGPYVIENVPGSPLIDPMVLCGASFGLGTRCRDGRWRNLRRHRLFETNVWMLAPGCACSGDSVGVYGDGGGGQSTRPSGGGGYKAHPEEARAAMGIDWAGRRGLANAIPPAYTEFIGAQLLDYLNSRHVSPAVVPDEFAERGANGSGQLAAVASPASLEIVVRQVDGHGESHSGTVPSPAGSVNKLAQLSDLEAS